MDRGRSINTLLLAGAMALLVLAVVSVVRYRLSGGDESSTATTSEQDLAMSGRGARYDAPPPAGAITSYTVSPGDTLSAIASRFGTTVESLMSANALANPDAVYVGQVLTLSVVPERDGPAKRTIPDSELVYGPAYADVDVRSIVTGHRGPLHDWSERVDGEDMSGIEIVERISWEFSVGPRVLLAFIEARGGWVTGATVHDNPSTMDYPAGKVDGMRVGLYRQLNWLADRLNGGYYDWKTRDNRVLTLTDGTHLSGHPALGPGSFAVQRALALQSTEAQLVERLAAFEDAYASLFGNPWEREVDTPTLGQVSFPRLQLPWEQPETWWITGGPHGGWADGSAWSAIDFVPDDQARGCYVSNAWTTAVADGLVLDGGPGQLWLDLDRDGLRQTGPVVFYLHLASDDRVEGGTKVNAGDPLGHPSCEGGMSNATHVHIARLMDGEWLAAAGDDAMTLGDWTVFGAPSVYDGGLLRTNSDRREACECRRVGYNDVTW